MRTTRAMHTVLALLFASLVSVSASAVESWTPATFNLPPGTQAGYFQRVLWDGARFVVHDDAGQLFTSPDGHVWTYLSASPTPFVTGAFAYGNGHYVIANPIGNDPGSGQGVLVYTSPDGVQWSTQTIESWRFAGPLSGLVFGNGHFVMLGGFGIFDGVRFWNALASIDGVTWGFAWPTGDRVESCVSPGFAGGRFVAQCFANPTTNAIAVSSDGLSWAYTPFVYPGGYLLDAAWGSASYVGGALDAAGHYQTLTSPDAATWTPVANDLGAGTWSLGSQWGLYLASPPPGAHQPIVIRESSNGTTGWTTRYASSAPFIAMATGAGHVVVLSDSAIVVGDLEENIFADGFQ